MYSVKPIMYSVKLIAVTAAISGITIGFVGGLILENIKEKPGLYPQHIGTSKIQTSKWSLVKRIHLDNLYNNYANIRKLVERLHFSYNSTKYGSTYEKEYKIVTPLPDPLGMEGYDRASDSDIILIDIKYLSVLFNIFSDLRSRRVPKDQEVQREHNKVSSEDQISTKIFTMPETPRTETPTSSTSYTLTDEQMTSLLTSMQQSQLQLLNQLVQNISPIQMRTGNFVDCTARFNGKKEADIEAFLDAVCIYKDCAKVTDENAIRGLPMLLTDEAATYWQGVKSSIHNWEDALKSLRSAYSVKLAPYRVYRELFEREQTDTETTELFVSKARALLAQLPDTEVLSEKIKLDMIYGLLNKRIRKRLTRDSVNTFEELLKGARSIEQSR
ncbi:hypothetical protein NQ317_008913 [Molorchus minor]|uniref:Retrotransposon gag domain-containing protein n=1 Tax=Molorchus minor TaxID=1323400 RepID=A0ABQ9JRG1_9CUCU|nr:hypothetical protein NQ317_008913 [Molorchus minor]